MEMKTEILSVEEFEIEAPLHMVIEILHEGEWLLVDEYEVVDEFIVILSNEQDYGVWGNITVRWSIDDE